MKPQPPVTRTLFSIKEPQTPDLVLRMVLRSWVNQSSSYFLSIRGFPIHSRIQIPVHSTDSIICGSPTLSSSRPQPREGCMPQPSQSLSVPQSPRRRWLSIQQPRYAPLQPPTYPDRLVIHRRTINSCERIIHTYVPYLGSEKTSLFSTRW